MGAKMWEDGGREIFISTEKPWIMAGRTQQITLYL